LASPRVTNSGCPGIKRAAIGALHRKVRECFFGTASEAPACEALPPETKRGSVTRQGTKCALATNDR